MEGRLRGECAEADSPVEGLKSVAAELSLGSCFADWEFRAFRGRFPELGWPLREPRAMELVVLGLLLEESLGLLEFGCPFFDLICPMLPMLYLRLKFSSDVDMSRVSRPICICSKTAIRSLKEEGSPRGFLGDARVEGGFAGLCRDACF